MSEPMRRFPAALRPAWLALGMAGSCLQGSLSTTSAAPAAPPGLVLATDAAGPVRLGMPAGEVERLKELEVQRTTRRVEGMDTPALEIRRAGKPQALVELQDGRVWRITVTGRDPHTAAGARVGMAARDLQRLYGAGQVLAGEGNVCAAFRRAPGLSFCFDTRSLGAASPTWARLARVNPRVTSILVVGKNE